MKVIYNEEKAILMKEAIDKETAEENERILKTKKKTLVASTVRAALALGWLIFLEVLSFSGGDSTVSVSITMISVVSALATFVALLMAMRVMWLEKKDPSYPVNVEYFWETKGRKILGMYVENNGAFCDFFVDIESAEHEIESTLLFSVDTVYMTGIPEDVLDLDAGKYYVPYKKKTINPNGSEYKVAHYSKKHHCFKQD